MELHVFEQSTSQAASVCVLTDPSELYTQMVSMAEQETRGNWRSSKIILEFIAAEVSADLKY